LLKLSKAAVSEAAAGSKTMRPDLIAWDLLRRHPAYDLDGGLPLQRTWETAEEGIPDNKSKRGGPDLEAGGAARAYEVDEFVKKHGMSAGDPA
jgi:hypothetical protein